MTAKFIRVHQLNAKLARLPSVVKGAIRAALAESAEEIANLARSLVPVDSGDLKKSIGWTYGKAPRGTITLATLAYSKSGDLTVTIYAGNDEAFYARWVEFGTKTGNPAQPFFFPSYRALRRRARSKVSRAINKAAKQVAAG